MPSSTQGPMPAMYPWPLVDADGVGAAGVVEEDGGRVAAGADVHQRDLLARLDPAFHLERSLPMTIQLNASTCTDLVDRVQVVLDAALEVVEQLGDVQLVVRQAAGAAGPGGPVVGLAAEVTGGLEAEQQHGRAHGQRHAVARRRALRMRNQVVQASTDGSEEDANTRKRPRRRLHVEGLSGALSTRRMRARNAICQIQKRNVENAACKFRPECVRRVGLAKDEGNVSSTCSAGRRCRRSCSGRRSCRT